MYVTSLVETFEGLFLKENSYLGNWASEKILDDSFVNENGFEICRFGTSLSGNLAQWKCIFFAYLLD